MAKAVAIAGIGAGHLKDLEVTRLLSVEESLSAMQIASRGKLPVPADADSVLGGVAIHHQDETQ